MIIEINKELVPYTFELDNYTFTIRYNQDYDFFTADVSVNGDVLAVGDKIVYGRPLFAHLRHLGIPTIPIIPLEIAGQEDRVTWDNLGEKVFLYLGDVDE